MKRKVEEYVTACPQYNVSKAARHLPYGQLQPITSPTMPLSVLSMDFITALPKAPRGNTILLAITDKYSRAARLIAGKDTDTAVN